MEKTYCERLTKELRTVAAYAIVVHVPFDGYYALHPRSADGDGRFEPGEADLVYLGCTPAGALAELRDIWRTQPMD